jgi:hypothetical protein
MKLISSYEGGMILVKVTEATISTIKSEVHDLIEKGEKPYIRLTMEIG